MSVQMKGVSAVAGVLLLLATGCISFSVSDCEWSFCGNVVSTEAPPERMNIDPAGMTTLKARTQNGGITLTGQADSSEAYVIVTKKAGGLTRADSEAALAAIEVYIEDSGPGTKLIAWRWKGEKRRNWGAEVSYDIKVPGNTHFEGETHNGPIRVDKLAGDVKAVSHNGEINVRSTGEKLYAETHNGEVEVAYTGNDITVTTYNGEIVADLGGCKVVSGSITTHNGAVELALGDATSTKLECETHSGEIDCDVPLSQSKFSRHQLRGTVGSGDGELAVTTYNGSVVIKQTTG